MYERSDYFFTKQQSCLSEYHYNSGVIQKLFNNLLDEKIEVWIKTFLIICKIELMKRY